MNVKLETNAAALVSRSAGGPRLAVKIRN